MHVRVGGGGAPLRSLLSVRYMRAKENTGSDRVRRGMRGVTQENRGMHAPGNCTRIRLYLKLIAANLMRPGKQYTCDLGRAALR